MNCTRMYRSVAPRHFIVAISRNRSVMDMSIALAMPTMQTTNEISRRNTWRVVSLPPPPVSAFPESPFSRFVRRLCRAARAATAASSSRLYVSSSNLTARSSSSINSFSEIVMRFSCLNALIQSRDFWSVLSVRDTRSSR